jgi:hypothetical protein
VHVTLGYQLVARLKVDVFVSASQVDTSSLAHVGWLDDKSLGLLLVKLVLQFLSISRQHPGLREEVELSFEEFLKSG